MVARARRPGASGAATTRGHLKVCALNHANADKMRTRDYAASFSRLVASVATAAETVPALDHADAPLAPRSPFLPVAEPALLLLAPLRRTLGGAIGNAHSLYPFGLGRGFVLGGVEARIRGHQTRCTPQHGFMRFDGWDQERGVVGALLVDLVVDHDLVFRFLQLDEFAKFVGLTGLALADDLG